MGAKSGSRTRHYFGPRGGCSTLFTCRDPEILLSGPAGTGKSRACMEKLCMTSLTNPRVRGLICRKTATSLSSTALVTWRRFVANELLLSGEMTYYGGSAQEPAMYRLRNGSEIVIGGLDKISKIMSAEYDMIYVQEATELTENDWEALTTRLRNWQLSYQQIIADCNPSYPTHWLKKRCDDGKTTNFPTIHEDNPVLFDVAGAVTERGSDYIGKLDRLTGVRYKRLRKGLWVAAEGVIWEDFTAETHVVDEIPVPKTEALDHAGIPISWRRYWGVDFGFVNPFVCQHWAEDPDGRLYMYREFYFTHRTVDQHAKEILAKVAPEGKWLEPKPTSIWCDHDAEGRATLEQELHLSTEPAHKAVTEGIESVAVRMRKQADGKPRIFLKRGALVREDPELRDASKPICTVEEIPAYVWADKKTKEQPIKEDDHGCDTMRYVVAGRDYGIRPIFRSFIS